MKKNTAEGGNEMKTIRMPKETLAKWLEGLRSGKYKQVYGALRNRVLGKDGEPTKEIGYCCLGVLQMVVDGKVEEAVGGTPSRDWLERNKIHFDNIYNPSQFATHTAPFINIGGKWMHAAEANDTYNCPFDDIADAIEQATTVV
jgi:hypothetical protein